MKKIIQTILSFGLVVSMLAIAPFASANYSINSSPLDCKTVGIGNRTTGQGIANNCWASSVSVKPGDEFVVGIYFHNSGTSPAQNVSFRMNDIRNQQLVGTSPLSITGSIIVNGTTVKTETVSFSSASGTLARVEFMNAAMFLNNTGVNTPVSNGANVFSAQGFSLGTLNPGTQNQGVFKVAFRVVEEASVQLPFNPVTPQSQLPTVSTDIISGLQNATGTVTLNGYFNANGSSASSYFRYRVVGSSSWINTATQNHGNTSGNVSRQITGLANGTYEYQLCVTNTAGTKCGKYNSSIDDPAFVRTFSIQNNISQTCPSGTFSWNGQCVQNCPSNTTWNGSVCVSNAPTCPSGTFSWNGQCVQNCPSGTYWNGSVCMQDVVVVQPPVVNPPVVNPPVSNQLASVSTLAPISVNGTAVAVDGFYSSTCAVTTWFEYGTTQSLGQRTNEVTRVAGQGSMAQSISGLSATTTYFYRAVAQNCAGINYGAIRSFTTGSASIVTPRPVVSGNGGGSFIKLMITNNRDTVRQGREIAYDLAWENVSGRTLNNLVLEVNFPEQMIITETERGQITRSGNSVIMKIATLAPRATGEMTIYTQVRSGLRDGDPVVAQAIMAFENPTTQATENAIAYDADEYSSDTSGLGASLFGLGFFPTSLAGWLLILLIIILIVLAVRYFMRREVVATVAQAPVAPPYAGAPTQDYVVYRPTPKQ